MRDVALGAVVVLFMGAAVSAQAPDAQVMAPIQKFIDSFNKGDVAGAAATHAAVPELSITDEVSPYIWRGAQAFKGWSGDLAYVVVPAVYTFKQGGVAMREAAQMTFALKKGADGWLIHAWTWTGPKPQKVAAPAKH